MTVSKRPLSPHLQVWKWTLTMAMSIFHRASGIALTVGLALLVWLLLAAATGPDAYATFMNFATSLIGKLMLFGWTFAIYLHMLSGIRHFIMDTGRMLTIENATRSVVFILLASAVLTAVTWFTVLGANQ